MDGYLTIKEIAKKWNLSMRRVQIMCSEGRISGVQKFGNAWAIPEDAEKPADGRVKTGKYKNWRNKKTDGSETR